MTKLAGLRGVFSLAVLVLLVSVGAAFAAVDLARHAGAMTGLVLADALLVCEVYGR